MRLKKSGTADSTEYGGRGLVDCRLAAEAHGVSRTATSRRRRVFRRSEAVSMATPWRALLRGLPGHAGGSPGKVDQIHMSYVQFRG